MSVKIAYSNTNSISISAMVHFVANPNSVKHSKSPMMDCGRQVYKLEHHVVESCFWKGRCYSQLAAMMVFKQPLIANCNDNYKMRSSSEDPSSNCKQPYPKLIFLSNVRYVCHKYNLPNVKRILFRGVVTFGKIAFSFASIVNALISMTRLRLID